MVSVASTVKNECARNDADGVECCLIQYKFPVIISDFHVSDGYQISYVSAQLKVVYQENRIPPNYSHRMPFSFAILKMK